MLRRIVAGIGAIGAGWVMVAGCGRAGDPSGADRSTAQGASRSPEGFRARIAEFTPVGGRVCQLCVWVADNAAQRRRGLMGVDDLGGMDAMAFVFPEATRQSYWMRRTQIALSIAIVDSGGRVAELHDMVPCRSWRCPVTTASVASRLAFEFGTERARELGVTLDTTIVLTDRACGRPDDR